MGTWCSFAVYWTYFQSSILVLQRAAPATVGSEDKNITYNYF